MLYSIDQKNVDQYADKLTEGTKALIKAHAGYRVDVYPTHRSVALPKAVQENSIKNATRAKLSEDAMAVSGADAGIPFPIPKNGAEAMFNKLLRYTGNTLLMPKSFTYYVDSSGRLTLGSHVVLRVDYPFYDENRPAGSTLTTRVRVNYTGPNRRAGEALLLFDNNLDFNKSRKSWQYLPGQRRVRLAPELSFDTPTAGSAGMATYDDADLFNGSLERFDWKLVGKKEMIVPYNTYRFIYAPKAEDVFLPEHVNPDLVRWELHRVWVVEATLKAGKRHIYARRTFYLDEDSWAALANEQYDARGQLWRTGYAYLAPAYDALVPVTMTAGHYDLIGGGYYIGLWPGPSGMKLNLPPETDEFWTSDSLASQGIR